MKVLVCGGAGYIGAHTVKQLAEDGHDITVFDNLSTGHRAAIKWGSLIEGDLLSADDVVSAFSGDTFDAVMHFSAKSLVSESVASPALYYENNVVGTLNLLNAMRDAGVSRFIFSSTAAVYGNPATDLISESHTKRPINPYGRSKWMIEQALADYSAAYGINSVSLRYFNAAGNEPAAKIGESHDPETHLIPNVLKTAASGRGHLTLFGDDYNTPDGTCVRDYVHVDDLAAAHVKALGYLESNDGAMAFNLGNGQGFSVFEVLHASEAVCGRSIPYKISPRRVGDPPILVADSSLARKELGWEPAYKGIQDIIRTAWDWHQNPQY